MEKIKGLINFFQTIKIETIINIAIAISVTIIFLIFSSYLAKMVIKIFKIKKDNEQKIEENSIYKQINLFFKLLGIYISCMILELPTQLFLFLTKIFKIATMILVANALSSIFDSNSKIFTKICGKLTKNASDVVINFMSKIAKTFIYLILIFIIMSELNYDLGGLLTGIGLGGVVLALAAQDIAKNLFGGFAIFTDKPFAIGDWIETKDHSGTVEDITFRSTRIRTADNTIITIPNSIISNEPITNWNKMTKRRYVLDLGITLETPIQEIEKFIQKLKTELPKCQDVLQDTIDVKLNTIKSDCVNLLIYMQTTKTAYKDYLEFRENINSKILKIVSEEKINLAYPTSTVYVEKVETNK